MKMTQSRSQNKNARFLLLIISIDFMIFHLKFRYINHNIRANSDCIVCLYWFYIWMTHSILWINESTMIYIYVIIWNHSLLCYIYVIECFSLEILWCKMTKRMHKHIIRSVYNHFWYTTCLLNNKCNTSTLNKI